MAFYPTKSILRRVFIYFILFALIIGALGIFFYMRNMKEIPLPYFMAVLGGFLIYFLLVYWYEIVRPLKLILLPIKQLLKGEKYKKIYTKRIDEIGIIAHFFNEVTKGLEKVSGQLKEGKRMLSELEIASKIQKDILPPFNPQVPGLEIIAKTRPAVELGGDNFDFITIGKNSFIYIGDVTGHGVPAAIVMTMANTLIHTFTEVFDNAYQVVVKTNEQIKKRIRSTMFMTMLMLRWDHTEQKMYYVGCGHEHLVIFRARNGKCDVDQTGGIALGMVPDNSKLVQEKEIHLEKDDIMILYSDGLTEGRNMSGEMYGLNRLVQAVERFAPDYGPDGIVNHVGQDYSHFVQDHIQEDDVTLIAIKYVGLGNEKKTASTDTSWTESAKVEGTKAASA